MLLTYFLNAYEIVPVAPIITGITVLLLLLLLLLLLFTAIEFHSVAVVLTLVINKNKDT
jgi:hypothetical protein